MVKTSETITSLTVGISFTPFAKAACCIGSLPPSASPKPCSADHIRGLFGRQVNERPLIADCTIWVSDVVGR